MARICFLVPMVIVAGVDEERSGWSDDEAGRLSAGGLSSDVGFRWGFLSLILVFGIFEGAEDEEGVTCTSPRFRKEFRGTWESLCL